jgi:hypothetical protein
VISEELYGWRLDVRRLAFRQLGFPFALLPVLWIDAMTAPSERGQAKIFNFRTVVVCWSRRE